MPITNQRLLAQFGGVDPTIGPQTTDPRVLEQLNPAAVQTGPQITNPRVLEQLDPAVAELLIRGIEPAGTSFGDAGRHPPIAGVTRREGMRSRVLEALPDATSLIGSPSGGPLINQFGKEVVNALSRAGDTLTTNTGPINVMGTDLPGTEFAKNIGNALLQAGEAPFAPIDDRVLPLVADLAQEQGWSDEVGQVLGLATLIAIPGPPIGPVARGNDVLDNVDNVFDTIRPVGASENLRLKLRREGLETQRHGLFQERRVLENKKTGKKMVVGDITFDDWKDRVATMDDEVIADFREWYKVAHGEFERVFGVERGERYLAGWLMGNQNASPQDAMLSLLRAEEAIKGFPTPKRGGLAHDRIVNVLSGSDVSVGKGPKIPDFIDSARGSRTRRFMDDDVRGGEPATADIHSSRDAGFVDSTYHNYLRRNFGNQADDVEIDMGNGPTGVQYENAANKLRDFSRLANEQEYLGGGWTPAEIQAVGWKFMGDEVGKGVATIPEALFAQTRRLSAELSFAPGSPFDVKFGEQFNALPFSGKAAVTEKVFRETLPDLMAIAGVRGEGSIGTGRYLDYPVMPSLHLDVLASPERAADVADLMGRVFQQNEIFRVRPKRTGPGIQMTLDIDVPSAHHRKFYTALRKELGPTAAGYGFDGDTLRVILEPQSKLKKSGEPGKKKEGLDAMEARMNAIIDDAVNNASRTAGAKTKYLLYRSEVVKHGGEDIWQEGRGDAVYNRAFSGRGRSDLQARVDDLTRTVEASIARSLANPGRQRKGPIRSRTDIEAPPPTPLQGFAARRNALIEQRR